MSSGEVRTENGRTRFRPGETIRGVVSWELEEEPAWVELGLSWSVKSRDYEDVVTTEAIPYEEPLRSDTRRFSLQAPNGPYSFDGKLMSLRWTLGLVAHPEGTLARLPITVSPTGDTVALSKEET